MPIYFASSLDQKIPIILGIALFSAVFVLSGLQDVNAQREVSVEILDVYPHEKKGVWWVEMNVCTEKYLNKPWFRLSSDTEFFTIGASGILPTGRCDDISYQIKADEPNSIEVSYIDKNPTEKNIILLSGEKESFPDKYLVRFKICAGEYNVVDPEIVARSDSDHTRFSFFANIGPGSCLDHDLDLKVNDLKTISVNYAQQLDVQEKFDDKNNIENISSIPIWVKGNAKLWSEGKLSDSEFTTGIEYMISQDIITISKPSMMGQEQQIPQWFRNNAGWWADGAISDNEFVYSIKYLIEKEIIRV